METITFTMRMCVEGVYYRLMLSLITTEGAITEVKWKQLPCDPDTGEEGEEE
jgi:hypothetical protein